MLNLKRKCLYSTVVLLALESYAYGVFLFLSSKGTPFYELDISNKIIFLIQVFLGIIIRPIASGYLTSLADRLGRRILLIASSFLMGLVTLLISAIPIEGGQLTLFLSSCFLLARALQVSIYGSDVSISAAYLVEIAPKNLRGTFGSLCQIGQEIGHILAIFVAIFFLTQENQGFLLNHSWRIPFISGGLAIILAFQVRYGLSESPLYRSSFEKAHPLKEVFKTQKLNMLKILGCVPILGISYYLYRVHLFTSSDNILSLSTTFTLIVNLIINMGSIVSILLGGYLSDVVGRKPILIASGIAMLLLALPTLVLINHPGAPQMVFIRILVGQLIMSLFTGLYAGALMTFLAEMFPTKIRATASGFPYNLGMSCIAATLPLLQFFEVVKHENYRFHGFNASIWALVAIIVVGLFMKETYKNKL